MATGILVGLAITLLPTFLIAISGKVAGIVKAKWLGGSVFLFAVLIAIGVLLGASTASNPELSKLSAIVNIAGLLVPWAFYVAFISRVRGAP